MSIYLPYVYLVTNRITNQFYIGMRSANKTVAEEDLGKKYFTSSKTVKANFNDYEITILAYFVDWESAFYFENETIKENWNNPLILNKHYQTDKTTFSMKGHPRPDLSESNKRLKSKPKEFREYECIYCRDTFYKEEHCHHLRISEPFCSPSCSAKFHGKSNGEKRRGIKHNRTSPAWNKGLKSPETSGENNVMNRPECKAKMKAISTGRKQHINGDGLKTWKYKDDTGWYINQSGIKIYVD